MTWGDLLAMLPMLATAAGVVAVLACVAIRRNHIAVVAVTLVALTGAVASLPVASAWAPRQVTPLLMIDGQALFYAGLFLAAAVVVTLISHAYLSGRAEFREEYYALLLSVTLGAMVLAASAHFASLFLGLELMSVSLYGLIAYCRRSAQSTEAGLKYLVMAGASSAFLLFGISLVYAETGDLAPDRLALSGPWNALTLAGLAMILVGVGFKLSWAPFHAWAPDVYQGAPLPVTALLATVSKGAVVVMLLRYLRLMGVHDQPPALATIAILAAASMFVGNVLALLQSNVKRLLAGSSIAHMGYVTVALLAGGDLAGVAVGLYLAAYFATMLAAFGVMTAASPEGTERQGLAEYRGLAWRRPLAAAAMTLAMFSLAGIPLTGGFFGKFTVFAAAGRSGLWWLLIVLAVNSGIGLYYYLRIVAAMYRPADPVAAPRGGETPAIEPSRRIGLTVGAAISVPLVVLVWIGVWPAPWMRLLESIAVLAR